MYLIETLLWKFNKINNVIFTSYWKLFKRMDPNGEEALESVLNNKYCNIFF